MTGRPGQRTASSSAALTWAAADMASDPDWSIFRRFDELNLLSLLILQEEIQKLTNDLNTSSNWASSDLAEGEEEYKTDGKSVWKDLRKKLVDYSTSLNALSNSR